MTTTAQTPAVRLAALAAALVPVFGALAQDEVDMQKLTKPGSAIELGAGIVDKDNRRFGQYNGMVDEGGYGLVDFNLNRRDEATGNWLQITGRNVGLENRELRLDHRQQGNWGYFLEFSQIPRYSPYTVNTGLSGIGTGTVAVNGVPLRDVDFNTTRDVWTVGASKLFAGAWDLQVRFRNEDKTGSRLWGRGNTGAGGFEFLADPIDYNTKQVEAILGYTGKSLQLSGGYYGTWFTNANTQLNSTGGGLASTTAIASNFQTMGLPPDNESHQLHLSGGYSFTPTTRGTFKVAYQRATQEDAFAQGFFVSGAVPSTVPLAPGVGTNLGGQVDTTLLQLGLTARPMQKLSVRADVRYNDRDDKTPLVQYFTGITPTSTTDGFNEPRSIATTNGKLEASYMLPAAVRLSGGVDYELKKRNTSPVRVVTFREETEELSYRAELRRTLSETLNGAVSFVHSDRDGSPWLTTTLFNGTVGSNLVHPLHLADRQRDRVRLSLDWTPVEKLALNFLYDQAKDDYGGNDRPFGAQKGEAQLYTVDALYSFSESLQLNAWFSSADTKAEPDTQMCENATSGVTGNCQAAGAGTLADPVWTARMRNLAETFGIGLRGKPTAKLELAAELVYAEDLGQFIQTAITPGAVIAQIPDVTYKRTIFKLNAKYAVQKNASVRFQYIYDKFKTDDWQWTTWTYTDGTTVRQEPEQRVNFAGISYLYEFR
jgi:MtrB/PioB family decaheme-associated outer membrane protein